MGILLEISLGLNLTVGDAGCAGFGLNLIGVSCIGLSFIFLIIVGEAVGEYVGVLDVFIFVAKVLVGLREGPALSLIGILMGV